MADKEEKSEKYVCLQCLKQHLQGKRDKRFANICRADASSVKRHKQRWHSLPNSAQCTIVPESAPEVSALKKEYHEVKPKDSRAVSYAETLSNAVENITKENTMVDDFEVQQFQKPKGTMEKTSEEIETNDGIFSDDSELNDLAPFKSHSSVKNQSTLLTMTRPKATEQKTDTSLKQVIDAVADLSLKIDSIGKQHETMVQLALEDGEVQKSLFTMRKAENILQLTESSQLLEWFYDETTECAVLRCLPCFQLHLAAKPTLAKLTPLKAQRLLNTSGSGTLATGTFLKKETTRLLIQGHNQTWYREKNIYIEHVCLIGTGSITHKKAMKEYENNKQAEKRAAASSGNVFRAAIADVKLCAAGRHFKTLISFLACCGANMGSIGHSRNNFNHILYCLEKIIDKRINTWLNTPLSSTLLPPHFWATTDKATPSRTTNQAVIIVARNNEGVPCPIPVASPPVYSKFQGATYRELAKQLLEGVSQHFSEDVLSRLCGVAADGPYQASGFAAQLRESLAITGDDPDLALPVTWDTAHVLHLAVTDVRDAQNQSGAYFRQFIKRCNVFNHVMSHGKGFAFLQMVD